MLLTLPVPAIPLQVALPAAVAGLAYINARASVWYDLLMLNSVIPAVISMNMSRLTGKISVFYRIEERAKSSAFANRPFILVDDYSYTYAQVYDRALRYGVWLKEKMAVGKGDVVAVDFMNSDTFIFLWLGLWSIGAKPAFINYNLRDQPLVHCIQTATTKLILVDSAVAEAFTPEVRTALSDRRIEVFSEALKTEIFATDPIRYPDELRHEDKLEDMAVLIFTSGTTGLPKAAVVSWSKLIVGGNFTWHWTGATKDDIYYTCMPLYHSSAILFCFCTMLNAGGAVAVGHRFSNKTFWPDVRKFKATMIQYVGETCRYLLVAPPQIDPATNENLDKKHSVRLALGNGLRPDVWNRFKERFGIETIAEFYGATEGTLATFNLSRNDYSMGAPWRDPRTGYCRRATVGEPGELVFKLPSDNIHKRFQGYYQNEKATQAKVMRNVFRKGDAWFRTGDVLRTSAEGMLYFHDRIGDTFRWKSENVSTTEVAHAVGLHPEVVAANVYGIEVPCHDGRAGCAAIELKDGPTAEFLDSLGQHVQQSLPRYALPLFLRVVQDSTVHTTGTNKQQKHVLREEGVDPEKVGSDPIFWLQDGTYKPFGRQEWELLKGAQVKL
ncbi:long-chain-fatty-acid-ligase 1 [Grosmannia clavigera kw1407]|uniref:Very long-chain fatty acid transport protein n=1 Tax=Grosmannia clavigera (strain kw1407 / UAMH 11150) TaxID=655863 RepID=F0XIR0_GROCL|nr:long-chain-fatty-acid-ligase 1 [Grosmannia clavigera kw1407]EFX02362.1 long-chain-fatty-acid-ligase 1 [Grosmannia clavigera kw1407]